LRPFLEELDAHKPPAVITQDVGFTSAVGRVGGYRARPDTAERLPAVLLLHDEQGLTDWMKQNARDLAGVGYVVLALDLPQGRAPSAGKAPGASSILAGEKTLAELSAAVRWLRRCPDVLPQQVGVVGWSWGGEQALALAAATPLQACVICDAPVTVDPALIAGLRGTPVLAVVAGGNEDARKRTPAFQKALAAARVPHKLCVYDGVRAGFMGPEERKSYAPTAADRAWFEVYEFLGKYVEDAAANQAPPPAAESAPGKIPVATIADIMRAVNAPTGVRGTLIRALEQKPATERQWSRVRANAALLADAGTLLQSHTPPRGTRRQWLEQVAVFRAAAQTIVAAADQNDYSGARRGLEQVAGRCAACHELHR
jgi:carboxymethylenebutenolidase